MKQSLFNINSRQPSTGGILVLALAGAAVYLFGLFRPAPTPKSPGLHGASFLADSKMRVA